MLLLRLRRTAPGANLRRVGGKDRIGASLTRIARSGEPPPFGRSVSAKRSNFETWRAAPHVQRTDQARRRRPKLPRSDPRLSRQGVPRRTRSVRTRRDMSAGRPAQAGPSFTRRPRRRKPPGSKCLLSAVGLAVGNGIILPCIMLLAAAAHPADLLVLSRQRP